jgi:hypothetical protein
VFCGAGFTGCGKSAFLSSRAKRGICFSSPNPRKSRFLGQTLPFGMTRCEFFRSHFSLWGLVLATNYPNRLKSLCDNSVLSRQRLKPH